MCTTSAECKTIITAMLTVMSSIDPHMISENLRWVWLGLLKWVSLGCGSVMVSLRDAIRIIISGDEVVIYLLGALRKRVNHCFLQVKPNSQAFLVDGLHVIFSPTC
jgi:hypothetical protein